MNICADCGEKKWISFIHKPTAALLCLACYKARMKVSEVGPYSLVRTVFNES